MNMNFKQQTVSVQTVTVDLYIIRSLGLALRQYFPDVTKRADIVALLDEWAARYVTSSLHLIKEHEALQGSSIRKTQAVASFFCLLATDCNSDITGTPPPGSLRSSIMSRRVRMRPALPR